jgi:hypothetical protein
MFDHSLIQVAEVEDGSGFCEDIKPEKEKTVLVA